MKIISIDQSFTSCGIVVLEDEVVAHAEKFTSDSNKDMFERAWDVSSHIVNLHKTHKADIVALEGLAFNDIGNQTRNLAGLQYTIITRLRFVENVSTIIVAPTAVKRVATGSGRAKKDTLLDNLPENILQYFLSLGVKKTTGLRDLCDAYWIGIAASHQYVS